jgi:chromosome segregation ATPase
MSVSKNVHFHLLLTHRDHREAGRHKGRPGFISQTIHLACFIIGLSCLAGCVESEQMPSTLEMTLESQAMQMAALSDRLVRCEHQWQTNADELHRHNQVTMRDLNAFRDEQTRLRNSIHDMDGRWSTQQEYMRNRQGQFQQSISDLNHAVKETDGRIVAVNQTLEEQIQTTRQELAQELDQLSENALIYSERINHLQGKTNAIGDDVVEIQNQHRRLRTLLTADNQAISGHLSTVAQNQEHIKESLGQTRTTAQDTVDKLQVVDSKQDQVVQWTQVHSQRLEKIDQGASARHVALTTEVKQVQQMAGTIQGQLANSHSQLTETAGTRFNQLEGQQEALKDQVDHNSQKLDNINRSLVVHHQSLETQLLEVADTGKAVSIQVRQGDRALGQQLTSLDQDQQKLLDWAHTQDQQQQQIQTREIAEAAAVTLSLGVLQEQGSDIQAQLTGMAQDQENLTQELSSRFGGVTAYQAQVARSLNQQGEKIDTLEQSLTRQETHLADEIRGSQDQLTHRIVEQGTATRAQVVETAQVLEQKLDRQSELLEQQHQGAEAQRDNITAQQRRLLAQAEQQHADLEKVDAAIALQGKAIQTGQADLGSQTTAQLNALESQHAQMMAADQRQQRRLEQLQHAAESQGQTLAEGASHLESLNQTLITQIHKIDESRAQLQQDLQGAQNATDSTIKERSGELQAQLILLSTILGRLEGRLEQTATLLNQSVQKGTQQEEQGTQELRSELQQLRKTVGQISGVQTILQNQLLRLETTVEDQGQAQAADLTQIKQDVARKKNAKEKSKGTASGTELAN